MRAAIGQTALSPLERHMLQRHLARLRETGQGEGVAAVIEKLVVIAGTPLPRASWQAANYNALLPHKHRVHLGKSIELAPGYAASD